MTASIYGLHGLFEQFDIKKKIYFYDEMTASTSKINIEPQFGEGIYLTRDIAKILRLNYAKVYRWIVGYWGGTLDEQYNYTFGGKGSKAINFLSLIEFYTFYKLREKGVSSQALRKFHTHLSKKLGTQYPFAIGESIFTGKRSSKKDPKVPLYYSFEESLIQFDSKAQFSFDFLREFLDRVEFDDKMVAVKFFPLENSKNIVVDPKHQLGQPIISGTNIKVATLHNLFNAGESIESISQLYSISKDKIKDAISFQTAA